MKPDYVSFHGQNSFEKKFGLPLFAFEQLLNDVRYQEGAFGVGRTLVDGGVFRGAFEQAFVESGLPERWPDVEFEIVGFEPNQANVAQLHKKGALVPPHIRNLRIDIRQKALGDTEGDEEFVLPAGSPETGYSPNGWLASGPKWSKRGQVMHVKSVRLDKELSAAPGLIKLDLQGGEMKALLGAGDLLKDTPILNVEAQMMRKRAVDIAEFLEHSDFDIYHDHYEIGYNDLALAQESLERLGIEITWKNPHTNILHGEAVRTGEIDLHVYGYDPVELPGINRVQTDFVAINRRYDALAESVRKAAGLN